MTFPPPIERRDRAVVLVHGAWVGEWCWSPVLPHLEHSARPVVNVSLTGHGSRSHQGGPHVTHGDHVADVVGVLETYDLERVTLVGHSYGGRVITSVAHVVPDRLERLVYIDAHAPTAADAGQSDERRREAAANGGMIEFRGYDPDPRVIGGEEALRWFLARVHPQSYATFTEPMHGGFAPHIELVYVAATGYAPSRFTEYAAAARADPGWRTHDIESDHWPMFSHPARVAEIILDA
ncbi:MAG: alpha/beta fold hydrolase [Ilumatobacteraceae bacterium]